MTEITIRTAVPDDVHEIVELVHDLAVYEKEPDAVKLTPEVLREQLFGERPAIFAHVAPAPEGSGRRIEGFALWFLNYSTWEGTHGIYLEDLYVRPEARGAGHHPPRFSPGTGARDREGGSARPVTRHAGRHAPCRGRRSG